MDGLGADARVQPGVYLSSSGISTRTRRCRGDASMAMSPHAPMSSHLEPRAVNRPSSPTLLSACYPPAIKVEQRSLPVVCAGFDRRWFGARKQHHSYRLSTPPTATCEQQSFACPPPSNLRSSCHRPEPPEPPEPRPGA